MKGRTPVIAGVALAFLALHVGLKLQHPPIFNAGGHVGQQAAAFKGRAIDGSAVSLEQVARGHRLTVVHFWETWCGPCQAELPDVDRLYQKQKANGLAVIGLAGTSDLKMVKSMYQDNKLSFPTVLDESNAIGRTFGVDAVPTTVVIGPDLKILRYTEGVDAGLWQFVENALQKGTVHP